MTTTMMPPSAPIFAPPVLPESAPFSPTQRAWLNGFFAGLANSGGSGPSPMPSENVQAGVVIPDAPAAEAEDESAPWHDPALSMDERLALAEGRPVKRRQ